jgi:hypothetical protein
MRIIIRIRLAIPCIAYSTLINFISKTSLAISNISEFRNIKLKNRAMGPIIKLNQVYGTT